MAPQDRLRVRKQSYFFAYALIASFLLLAHGPLLHTAFFWDEGGQFVPAALDIFRLRAWIPVSTVPNAHPPGVMAWLAAFWSVFGFSIATTRVAMLLVASGGALVSFLLAIELSRRTSGTPAFTALALLCVSPLFFSQSMLAQLDMPAMCLTALALLLFLQNHWRTAGLACVALVLVKETGVVLPLVLAVWIGLDERGRRRLDGLSCFIPAPVILAIWLFALHRATGSWFGNPGFTDYNIYYALRPGHLLLAILRRLYYLFIGSGHFIGTAALIWAWRRMPQLRERPWRIVASFVAAHVVVVSLLGGAILERYLLPVLPLVYIAFAVAIRALLPRPRAIAVLGLAACLATANLVNPVYPFPYENNLAFVSFVQVEQEAIAAAEFTGGIVASAFPVTNGLRKRELGYVENPPRVRELPDFSQPSIDALRNAPPDSLILYDRFQDPLGLLKNPLLAGFLRDHYAYHPQLAPAEIARQLRMYIARRWTRRGITMYLLRSGEPPPGYDRVPL